MQAKDKVYHSLYLHPGVITEVAVREGRYVYRVSWTPGPSDLPLPDFEWWEEKDLFPCALIEGLVRALQPENIDQQKYAELWAFLDKESNNA